MSDFCCRLTQIVAACLSAIAIGIAQCCGTAGGVTADLSVENRLVRELVDFAVEGEACVDSEVVIRERAIAGDLLHVKELIEVHQKNWRNVHSRSWKRHRCLTAKQGRLS